MSTGAALSFLNQYRWLTFPAAMEMEPKSKAVSRAFNAPEARTAVTAGAAAGAAPVDVAGPLPGFAAMIAIARASTITTAPSIRFRLIERFGATVALRVIHPPSCSG